MRKIKKVLAAILGMAMLMGSVTVFAAGAPGPVANPTWGDVWDFLDYMDDLFFIPDGNGEIMWVANDDLSYEISHNPNGTVIIISDNADSIIAAYDVLTGDYREALEEGAELDDLLDDTYKSGYNNLCSAGIALCDIITTATGECYFEHDEETGENVDPLWIEFQAAEDRANSMYDRTDESSDSPLWIIPDDAEPPEEDVEWVRQSDWDTFTATMDGIYANYYPQDGWDNFSRAQAKDLIDRFMSAFNALNASIVGGNHTPEIPEDTPSTPSGTSQSASAAAGAASGAGSNYTPVRVNEYEVFNKKAIRDIEKAKGSELIIDAGNYISFHKSVFEALAKRPDLAVTINYKYRHKKYTVTIPAGADLSKLCNEEGFCGFRYLDLVFGGREITQ